MPKLLAEHEKYGRVLILTKNEKKKWAIADIDPMTKSPRVAGAFKIMEAARY